MQCVQDFYDNIEDIRSSLGRLLPCWFKISKRLITVYNTTLRIERAVKLPGTSLLKQPF